MNHTQVKVKIADQHNPKVNDGRLRQLAITGREIRHGMLDPIVGFWTNHSPPSLRMTSRPLRDDNPTMREAQSATPNRDSNMQGSWSDID